MYTVIREGEVMAGHRIDTDVLVYAYRDTPQLRGWIATYVLCRFTRPALFKVRILFGRSAPPFVGEEYEMEITVCKICGMPRREPLESVSPLKVCACTRKLR